MTEIHYRILQVTIAAVGVALLASCGNERESLLVCQSPDGTHKAEFYREFGGGAAGWQTENVAVTTSRSSTPIVIFKMSHGYDIGLTWKSPTELEVAYPDGASVSHWESDFDFKMDDTKLIMWRSYLVRLPSKDGVFVNSKSYCDSHESP